MLNCMYNAGRYVRYLPSVASSLMEHLGLGKSDVFFNRIRVYAREVGIPVNCHFFLEICRFYLHGTIIIIIIILIVVVIVIVIIVIIIIIISSGLMCHEQQL